MIGIEKSKVINKKSSLLFKTQNIIEDLESGRKNFHVSLELYEDVNRHRYEGKKMLITDSFSKEFILEKLKSIEQETIKELRNLVKDED